MSDPLDRDSTPPTFVNQQILTDALHARMATFRSRLYHGAPPRGPGSIPAAPPSGPPPAAVGEVIAARQAARQSRRQARNLRALVSGGWRS